MSYAMTDTLSTNDVVDNTIKDQVYYENGTIIKPEKRGIITKMKQWYYKHVIETGRSAKWEERTDKTYKLMKKLIAVTGSVASVALLVVPGGQAAAALTILATPALMGLVALEKDLERKLLITLKRKAEQAMGFENQGYSQKVNDADITLDELKDGATTIIKEAPKAVPKLNGAVAEPVEIEEVASRGMR